MKNNAELSLRPKRNNLGEAENPLSVEQQECRVQL